LVPHPWTCKFETPEVLFATIYPGKSEVAEMEFTYKNDFIPYPSDDWLCKNNFSKVVNFVQRVFAPTAASVSPAQTECAESHTVTYPASCDGQGGHASRSVTCICRHMDFTKEQPVLPFLPGRNLVISGFMYDTNYGGSPSMCAAMLHTSARAGSGDGNWTDTTTSMDEFQKNIAQLKAVMSTTFTNPDMLQSVVGLVFCAIQQVCSPVA
jgi:hypothetical protein